MATSSAPDAFGDLPSRRLPFPLDRRRELARWDASGQSLRRVFPRAPIVRHARLRSVAVSGSGPERLGGSSWTLPLPVLRRASSEPTTLPRSSVCQAGRSKNTAAPAPARSFASLAVASSMRSKTSKPGPPSAHATPRPIPDNSHPRAARFRRRAYAAVEGCHGCAARSTTSKSNS